MMMIQYLTLLLFLSFSVDCTTKGYSCPKGNSKKILKIKEGYSYDFSTNPKNADVFNAKARCVTTVRSSCKKVLEFSCYSFDIPNEDHPWCRKGNRLIINEDPYCGTHSPNIKLNKKAAKRGLRIEFLSDGKATAPGAQCSIKCLDDISGPTLTEEWTCEECWDGSISVGNFYVERGQIGSQWDYLERKVDTCSAHPSPSQCSSYLRELWKHIGPMIWRGQFSYMCADKINDCDASASPTNTFGNITTTGWQERPICKKCTSRVDAALTYLKSETVINGWVQTLKSFYPCNDFNTEDECFSYLETLVPEILNALVDWKNLSLAKEWCHHWGSCTENQINKM